MNIYRFSYRGLSPHKFTPMPGVHEGIQRTADHAGESVDALFRLLGRVAGGR
jgi:hypothetical protein